MEIVKKFYLVILLVGFVVLASCKKDNIPANGNEVIGQTQIVYSGVLVGGESGDEARGDVTIEKLGTKYFLVFKNFQSNSGPDVHVYLSKTAGNHANPPHPQRILTWGL